MGYWHESQYKIACFVLYMISISFSLSLSLALSRFIYSRRGETKENKATENPWFPSELADKMQGGFGSGGSRKKIAAGAPAQKYCYCWYIALLLMLVALLLLLLVAVLLLLLALPLLILALVVAYRYAAFGPYPTRLWSQGRRIPILSQHGLSWTTLACLNPRE